MFQFCFVFLHGSDFILINKWADGTLWFIVVQERLLGSRWHPVVMDQKPWNHQAWLMGAIMQWSNKCISIDVKSVVYLELKINKNSSAKSWDFIITLKKNIAIWNLFWVFESEVTV